MKYIICVLAVSFLLVGCAGNVKKLTIEEKIELGKRIEKSSKRTYKNISKAELQKAIGRVLELADDSTTISFADNQISAHRSQLIYLIFSATITHFNWKIELIESEDETKVSTDIIINQQVMLTNMGDHSIKKDPRADKFYHFFYSRVDYMLGLTDKWQTCEEVDKNSMTENTFQALCLVGEDKSPKETLKQTKNK